MDFDYSLEQTQIADSLKRFLSDQYSFEQRSQYLSASKSSNQAVWQGLADLGILGIAIPEEYGGFGGGALDTHLVMNALGKALVVEPYLASVVMAPSIMYALAGAEQKQEYLPAVVSGTRQIALAHTEPDSRYRLAHVECRAERTDAGWKIDGVKSVVQGGASADTLIVSARSSGDVNDDDGISLFLLETTSTGLTRLPYPQRDGSWAADFKFDGVLLSGDALLGAEGNALASIEAAVDQGIAALCSEAVGIMETLIELSSEYLKMRKQFGVALATFQVLQHRMADMLLHLEQARSMSLLLASKLSATPAERAKVASAAKVLVGDAARFVGQEAVQLHGGIGVTDEVNVSHYFKRLVVITASFGDRYHHLARFSDLMVEEQLARDANTATR
jgi:alkylation response protein AidB-like acyl-CoA dehydrogenase